MLVLDILILCPLDPYMHAVMGLLDFHSQGGVSKFTIM